MTGRWTRYAGLLFLVVTLLACKMLKGQKSYEGNVADLKTKAITAAAIAGRFADVREIL